MINPSWLGVYVGIIAIVALTVQAGCGSFIIRYGSLRISQISLLFTGIGLSLAAPGFTSLMILSAVAIGASASSTPAPISSSALAFPDAVVGEDRSGAQAPAPNLFGPALRNVVHHSRADMESDGDERNCNGDESRWYGPIEANTPSTPTRSSSSTTRPRTSTSHCKLYVFALQMVCVLPGGPALRHWRRGTRRR